MNIIQMAKAQLNVTNTDLAELLSIPYRTVYKWEKEEREPPASAVTAVKLLMFVESHNLLNEWITERDEIMSKSQLLAVAEAIMDSAAEEYRSVNLASVEAVQAYAEGAMDVFLTNQQAAKIRDTCLTMVEKLEIGDIPDEQDWHQNFTKTLS